MLVKLICFTLAIGAVCCYNTPPVKGEVATDVNKAQQPKVKLFTLNDGHKMPALGLGTWQANGKSFEVALEAAIADGYRHIDTATVYGNEEVIGKVLKKLISAGKVKREELFIVTKLPDYGLRPSGVKKYVSKSLTDMQLDYIDMYLIHSPFGFKDIDATKKPGGKMELDLTTDHIATWKKMEEEVEKGRIRSIGLSNFNQTQIERVYKAAKIKPSNLQIELHAFYQQTPLVEYCKKKNIIVTAYSPLGAPGNQKFTDEHKEKVDILNNKVVKEIAAKHKKTPAQILLRYTLARGIAVIPKSTNEGRLKENINVFDFELDPSEMAKMKALDKPKGKILGDFGSNTEYKSHPEYPWHNE